MEDGLPSTGDLSGSQSVDRALRLLALVGRGAERGIGLSVIVEESHLNKPTARRLLLALMRAGLVEQDQVTRRYYLGEEAYVLGTLSSRRHSLLELSMESLRRLSEATMDTSFVSMRRDNYSVCLHREEGTFPVRTHALQAGYQHPLGIGAGSLAILAAMSDDDIEGVLEAVRPVLLEKYPSYSIELILEDVQETRRRGYSLNPGRIVASSWGVGAAIMFPDGRVAGALSIAAIDSRMTPSRQPELGALLKAEIAQIETKLRKMFASRASGAAEPPPRMRA
ncbi:helix-turn-helix domain-containing protein [Microvirga makkahensis]|uniref:Helix-turn-helix domain-containing protein n=2 Tax=Microvirga makkahensis TaxID=1128670 RepID=A0A7X3MRZ4_9HYPH|nr:helix-turn-helix domain-containing protein [Microvirga makkahensis]